jgi:hypothetical protein
MRFRLTILLAFFVTFSPSFSAADPRPGEVIWEAETGEMLLNDCNPYIRILNEDFEGMTAKDYFHAGLCKGSIEAAYDTMALNRDLFKGAADRPVFCVSHTVSSARMAKTVVAYGDAHPEFQKVNAQSLIGWALADAYPCPAAEWVEEPGVCKGNDENCG